MSRRPPRSTRTDALPTRRSSDLTLPGLDPISVVLEVGVEIFEAQRQLVGHHHLGPAPDAIAPGVAFTRVGKAVGGVGGREAVLHLRIGAAARDIEKRAAARRVAGAQPGTGLILNAAG